MIEAENRLVTNIFYKILYIMLFLKFQLLTRKTVISLLAFAFIFSCNKDDNLLPDPSDDDTPDTYLVDATSLGEVSLSTVKLTDSWQVIRSLLYT